IRSTISVGSTSNWPAKKRASFLVYSLRGKVLVRVFPFVFHRMRGIDNRSSYMMPTEYEILFVTKTSLNRSRIVPRSGSTKTVLYLGRLESFSYRSVATVVKKKRRREMMMPMIPRAV